MVEIAGFQALEFHTGQIAVRNSPELQDVSALARTGCAMELVVENTGLNDLSDFDAFYALGRVILRDNDDLETLEGFDNLTYARGPVRIEDNDSLPSLDGLWDINRVDPSTLDRDEWPNDYRDDENFDCVPEDEEGVAHDLRIVDNDRLRELSELELRSVPDTLALRDNDRLDSLEGLDQLESTGELIVADNDALESVDGFTRLEQISDLLLVEHNESLRRIDGFEALQGRRHSDDLVIASNPVLESIDGFDDLENLEGSVEIVDNERLGAVDGFESLGNLDQLVVRDNGVFDLDFAASISWVDGNIDITSNPKLETLDDLVGLNIVSGNVRVEQNDALANVRGLENLSKVEEGFYLQENPSLPACEADWIDGHVDELGFLLAEDNGPECDEE